MRSTHLFVLCAPLAAACATFAEVPSAALTRTVDSSLRPSAYLEVSVETFMTNRQGDRGYRVAPWGWPKLVEESLSDSGMFSAVSLEQGQQDLRVSVSLTATQTPMSNALLALLTLFLIPATDERSLTVVATIHDPELGVDASAEYRHEFRTWLQLFLIPLSFTHNPGSYEYELAARLSSVVVSQALDKWAASVAARQASEAVRILEGGSVGQRHDHVALIP